MKLNSDKVVDMKKLRVGIWVLMCFASPISLAETELQSLENISQELVNIRQQIEALHNKITFEKDSYRDQMRSYSSQKSDLNVRVSRAELNIKDIQRELKKLTDVNKEKNQDQKKILPILKVAIEQIRESVTESIPFKLDQRLQVLKEIEHRLGAQIISPNKATNQLWAFVEDELMLGKSSGIYNETLEIEDREKLVKVLRIGKIAMFFKTQDNQYGVMKRKGNAWYQEMVGDTDNVSQLSYLFDSFAKNIRNGEFSIPNILPKS